MVDDMTQEQLDVFQRRAMYDCGIAEHEGQFYIMLNTSLRTFTQRESYVGPFADRDVAATTMAHILMGMNDPAEIESRVQAMVEELRAHDRAREAKLLAMQQEGEGVIAKVLTREGIEAEYGWTVLVPLTSDMLGRSTYNQKPAFHAFQLCEDGWVDLDFPATDAMKTAVPYALEHAEGPVYLIAPKTHQWRCQRKGEKPAESTYREAWRITKMDYHAQKTYHVGPDGRQWRFQYEAGMNNQQRTLDFDTKEAAEAWIEAEKKRILDEYLASDEWKRKSKDTSYGGTPRPPHTISHPGFGVKKVKVHAKRQLLLAGTTERLALGTGEDA